MGKHLYHKSKIQPATLERTWQIRRIIF